MQRRHHCELAFEEHLRRLRLPYVAVDEAKKSLLPLDCDADSVKSFDFLVSAPSRRLLVDVKGRKLRLNRGGGIGRLENWVTRDDLRSLARWETIFGNGFEAVFVFAYWTDRQPPDGMFEHLLESRGLWYALRVVSMRAYQQHARLRSEKWETMDLAPGDFEKLQTPLTLARCA